MLLIPEVSKTFAESVPLSVGEHARLVDILLRGISNKHARRESPSSLWLGVVACEIRWSYNHRDNLTFRHRQSVANLLEWYCSQGAEFADEWLSLFPESEVAWRLARAELNWCSAHVNQLSRRSRFYAMDLLADFCAANPGEFRQSWRVLIDAEIPSC